MAAPPILPDRVDVLVVGAGISGLALAWHLRRAGRAVAVLESSAQVGGALATIEVGGFRFELGPNTVAAGEPALERLLAGCGLAGRLLDAGGAGRRRFLWHGGRLVALPGSPLALFASPLLSPLAKARLLVEPGVRRARPGEEESVAAFFRRRLGGQVAARLVAPFVSGVWAGDPERLAMAHAFPRLVALEQAHGSLLLGLTRGPRPSAPGVRGKLVSLPGGWGELARALAEQVGAVFPATPCLAVEAHEGGFEVTTPSGKVRALQLVMATPADVTARLLAAASGGASLPLAEIPYAPLVVASLGVRREHLPGAPDGFGFLARRGAGLSLLGCLFPSRLFPGRAPEGYEALTAFLGGRTDPALVQLEDEAIWSLLAADLERAVGWTGEAICRHLQRWPRAIPQYELGHGRFLSLAEQLERQLPGLHLAGNYLRGISVPDCVAAAERRAGLFLAG